MEPKGGPDSNWARCLPRIHICIRYRVYVLNARDTSQVFNLYTAHDKKNRVENFSLCKPHFSPDEIIVRRAGGQPLNLQSIYITALAMTHKSAPRQRRKLQAAKSALLQMIIKMTKYLFPFHRFFFRHFFCRIKFVDVLEIEIFHISLSWRELNSYLRCGVSKFMFFSYQLAKLK